MDVQNKKDLLYYLFDMFCFCLGLFSFLFALYVIPYLFIGIQYEVPDFFISLTEWIANRYQFIGFKYSLACLAPFLITGILLLLISSRITVNVERRQLNTVDYEAEEEEGDRWHDKASTRLTGELMLILGGMALVIYLVDLLLT